MSLDPTPSDAELIRMAAERQGRSRRATFVTELPERPPETFTASGWGTVTLPYVPAQTVTMPIQFRIPWSALISDNGKHTTDQRTGKRYCTTEYREARKRVRQLATDAMQGRPPAECPLSLVARVWLPNNRRHDVHNYGKCIHDALTGVVFADDSWLYDTRWIRAGVDVDAPRCELTITPLTP